MENKHYHRHEHKTKLVIYITAATMIVEIVSGYYTNSMALLADGWHMASHVFALGLTWVGYFFVRKHLNNKGFKNGSGKILALSGYTSAVVLQVVAILMAIKSFERILNPVNIHFQEAIAIAIIGLLVNILSAFLLHHHEEHSDHNIKAAYLHVLADALTSVTAIIALIIGMYLNIYYLDALSGIISSIVITKWAIDLMKNSGKELLDYSKHEILN